MAFPKTTAFVLALFTLAVISSSGTADLLEDFTRGAKSLFESASKFKCILDHKAEFDDCYSKISGIYSDKTNKDNLKEFCCSYTAYSDCVTGLSDAYCGSDAAKIAEGLINSFRDMPGINECSNYDSIIECLDPVMLIAVIAVAALVGLLVLGCLAKICCACCS